MQMLMWSLNYQTIVYFDKILTALHAVENDISMERKMVVWYARTSRVETAA